MMENETHIELFERYKNGGLNQSELLEFEARLVYDAEFNKAYQSFQAVEQSIKSHFRNELKAKLAAVDQKMDKKPKQSKIIQLAVWSSSVAAAIVMGAFIFQHFATPKHVQLAQKYWIQEAGLPVKMSNKGKYDDAMNAFKQEQWEKAEELLLKIDSDTSSYFLGVIGYEQQDYEQASNYLIKINQHSNYYYEAQFRLALSYLSQEKTDLAKQMLELIVKSNSPYKLQASELLEEMK